MNLKKLLDRQFKVKSHSKMDTNEFNEICRIVQIPFDMLTILKAYTETHRHFHTPTHVLDLLRMIESDVFDTDREKFSFYCAALFHDVVYEPRRKDNELQSSLVFCQAYKKEYESIIDFQLVNDLINGTALIDDRKARPEVQRFNSYDRIVLTKPVDALLEYGEKIWKEYSHVPYSKFLEGHFALIRTLVCSTYHNDPMLEIYLENINEYEKVMENKRLKVGVYAGSFNPFHIGHLDVLQQAERLFDKVILASGINPAKVVISDNTIPVMDVVIDGVPLRFEQVQFNMLLGRYVEKLEREENYDVTIVRGIRDETDVHSELLQRKYSMEMNRDLKYVFLASSPGLEHISSSGIRTLQMFQEDVSEYLPPPTRNKLGYLD